jgi:hypothetical protein
VPCSGSFCPGWEKLDNNPRTLALTANGVHLYQWHDTGDIWRYIGVPCIGEICPGWQKLDNNPRTRKVVAPQ